MPLFLFHLLEYLDVDYELDVDEINERWAQDVERRRLEPARSSSRPGDDGRAASRRRRGRASGGSTTTAAVAFARWGNDWHSLHDESEAFFLRVLGPGRLPLPGRRPRRARRALAHADRRQPADRPRAREWIDGVHAQFAGTPLRRARASRPHGALAFKTA